MIDLSGHVVMPGLVNTHHHMYQNLTRVMVQDDPLFVWLTTLYPIWARLDDDAIRVSASMAMAELIASGCTTSSDHLHILPDNVHLDTTIEAAADIGLRFHAARGAMSRGQSKGGLPPDACVEDEAAILKDAERLIHRYHDRTPGAMTRIVLARCSPFSVTPGLMRDAAALARRHTGVRLHSHIAEVLEEETYCHETCGTRSVAFAESVGWLGPDMWFAHAIFPTTPKLPSSRRPAPGPPIAPRPTCAAVLASCAREMRDAGVTVGLGVDGAASNDRSNMFLETRLAMLLQRVTPARYLSAPPGGRDDIGQIAPGKAADVIAVDLNQIGMAGAERDPLGALVLCGPFRVDHSFINGVQVIDKGRFTRFDVGQALADHRATMRRIHDA